MATYYVRTDGNDGNAGTANTSGGAWLTIAYAMTQVAAGDTVYVVAAAGNAATMPTSGLDFSLSTYGTPASGTEAAGYVRWVGLGGMPTIGCAGLAWYNAGLQWFENLYLVATANTFGDLGMIGNCAAAVLRSCVLNLNNQSAFVGARLSDPTVIGCDFYGGSASPSASAGSHGLLVQTYNGFIQGNRFRYCRDAGINVGQNGVAILNNLIYGNAGNGVQLDGNSVVPAQVIGNTIHGNGGHGVAITASNAAIWAVLRNNNITGHTQSGKAGISVATGSSDPRRRGGWGYNNVWNNTTNYSGVTADPTDFSVDPDYVDAATGDFTPQEASILDAAFPTAF